LTSPALCQRSSGSFARHCVTTRWNAGGASGTRSAIGFGSSRRTALITLAVLAPSHATAPVAIS
jgi:hypothetical protein